MRNLKQNTLKLIQSLQSSGVVFHPDAVKPHPELRNDLPAILNSELAMCIDRIIDYKTFEWIRALSQKDIPEWYVVDVAEDAIEIYELWAWQQLAPSLEVGISYILEELCKSRTSGVTAQRNHNGIRFYIGKRYLAGVTRAEYESVSDEDRKRALNATKGICLYDDPAHIESKLKKIRGFGQIDTSSVAVGHRLRGDAIYMTARNILQLFTDALAKYCISPPSRGLAQEIIAAFFGFQSWNHWTGLESSRGVNCQQPVFVVSDGSVKVYRTLVDGLVAFGGHLLGADMKYKADFGSKSRITAIDGRVALFETEVVSCSLHMAHFGVELKNADAKALMRLMAAIIKDNLPPTELIMHYNCIAGTDPELQVAFGDWVFWVDGSLYEGVFCAQLSTAGARNIHSSNLRKTSIVEVSPGEYWVSTDWDGKAVYQLSGIGSNEASVLVQKFLRNSLMIDNAFTSQGEVAQ